ncbi:amino acid adenylation domain-containing protein [Paenibacillus amylolyticus]|uniref:amino acid adenylation domain-containing protein n=1 Tax=Paenibacillus amylolyticus TaxID=1451 RepID=UPI0032426ED0
MNDIRDFINDLENKNVYLFTSGGKLKTYSKSYKLSQDERYFIKKNKLRIISAIFKGHQKIDVSEVNNTEMRLSFQQERLWLADKISSAGQEYNSVAIFHFQGPLETAKFQESFENVLTRHEVLRTIYKENSEGIIQNVLSSPKRSLTLFQFEGDDVEEFVRSEARKEGARRFDLSLEIPVRANLIKGSKEDNYFILNVHHIVWDGWSIGVFMADLEEYYNAKVEGRKPNLAPLSFQYKEYSEWQRDSISNDVLESLLNYWGEYLKDIPTDHNLPFDYDDAHKDFRECDSISFSFPSEKVNKFKELCYKYGTTPFVGLHTVLAVLWHKLSSNEDIVIGSPVANREQAEIANLVGFFVNMITVRSSIKADTTLEELIEQMKRNVSACLEYQQAPFEKIVEKLAPERDKSVNPLFQTVLAYQNNSGPDPKLKDINSTLIYEGQPYGRFEIEIHIFEGDDFNIEWIYSINHFERSTMELWIEYFEKILDYLLLNVHSKISDLQLKSENVVISNYCECEVFDFPKFDICSSIDNLSANNKYIAIEKGRETLSYESLAQNSSTLAQHLRGIIPGEEATIGINYPTSNDAVIAMVAVLKAGFTYTFIDADIPKPRLKHMLHTANIKLLLTPSVIEDLQDMGIKQVSLVELFLSSKSEVALPKPDPESIAYIMFTSGTTGLPKGVKISRKNISHYVSAFIEKYSPKNGMRYSWHSNMLTDFVNTSLYLSLCTGGTLVLPEDERIKLDKISFSSFLTDKQIEFLKITPSHFKALIQDFSVDSLLPKSFLVFGGEKLEKDLFKQVQISCISNGIRLINHYGPTETTVGCLSMDITEHNPKLPVPIGSPFAGNKYFILDNNKKIAPPGVFGELYVAGNQVSIGYLNSDSKDHDKYGTIKVLGEEYRAYNTGDLVRWTNKGYFEYKGRKDNQIKVRGFRVELGEIEAHSNALPFISDSKALINTMSPAHELILFYTKAENVQGVEIQGDGQEFVQLWKDFYNYNYTENANISTFNISGWLSSYDGKQIPENEMKSWLNDIVEIIMSDKPSSILEIGCGFGIFAFTLSEMCDRYIGIDFSEKIIEQNNNIKKHFGYNNVHFICEEADGISNHTALFEKENIDTVVINSVVQYFPSIEYLEDVISSILEIKTVKHIVIGDVRNYELIESFHTSVELHQLHERKDLLSEEDLFLLAERVKSSVKEENELLLSPQAFFALNNKFPEIGKIEIIPRKSVHTNELVRFRFDVKISLNTDTVLLSEHTVHDEVITSLTYEHYKEKFGLLTDFNAFEHFLSTLSNAAVVRKIPYLKESWIYENLMNHKFGQALALIDSKKILETFDLCMIDSFANQKGLNLMVQPDFEDNKFIELIVINRNQNKTLVDSYLRNKIAVSHEQKSVKEFSNNPILETGDNSLSDKSLIQKHLNTVLPEHMIPTKYILVESFPLNSTGKLDTKKLLTLSINNEYSDIALPEGPTETALMELFSKVIGKEIQIDRNISFFEIGGNSLMATRLSFLIKKELSIDINVGDIFDAPSIQELTEVIDGRSKSASDQTTNNIVKRVITTPVLASWSQERLWILEQIIVDSSPYNIGHLFRLEGSFDLEIFKQSLHYLLKRHEILRTTFLLENSQVLQDIKEEIDLTINNLSITKDQVDSDLKELVHEHYNYPFDLSENCFRVTIIHIENSSAYYLLFAFHHIIFDGSSESIFFKELSEIYSDLRNNLEVNLKPLPIQFSDYALWDRSQMAQRDLDASKVYWDQQLSEIPDIHGLPLDFQRPVIPSYKGGYITRLIFKDKVDEFKKICNENRVSLFMGLHAIFVQLVARKSGQNDISIGTPTAGRYTPQLDELIGFFVNTLVLRTDIEEVFTFKDLFKHVKETDIAAFSNQAVGFDYLVNKYAPNRNLSYSPLFQLMFILQNMDETPFTLEGSKVESMPLWYDSAKFDITLNSKEIDGELHMVWEYATDLFKPESIQNLAESFETLLDECIKDSTSNIFEVPLDKHKIENQRNEYEMNNSTNLINPIPLISSMEQDIQNIPMNIALSFKDEHVAFGELDQLASKVAFAMLQKGVKEGSLVGISLDISIKQLVSVLATLKLGASFVPLDSEYLKMRSQETFEDTKIDLIVGDSLDFDLSLTFQITHEELDKIFAEKGPSISGYVPSMDNNAYVIFTSGTTGKPKGVQITQRALLNYLSWCKETYTQNDFDKAVMHSPLSFDATITSSFFPLFIGKPVIIIPRENTLGDLEDLIKTSDMRLLIKITPAHLDALHTLGCTEKVRDVKHTFVIGGDALSRRTIEPWLKAFPNSLFFNEYGPTEATVGCCVKKVSVDDLKESNISIGAPINNIELFIMDNDCLIMGDGTGELCIAGDSLSKGYINSVEETNKKFIEIGPENKRIYKTGDMVTRDSGEFTYIRRMTDEFKINGYRINTGEIEEVLVSDDKVEDALVLIDKQQSAIIGFVTGDETLKLKETQNDLISSLSQKFPVYMVPNSIVWMESFPLTSNGKVDKKILLSKSNTSIQTERDNAGTELNPAGVIIYEIWSSILGLKNIPRATDTFFSLGGSSMLATQVVSHLSSQYRIKIKIRDVFVHSSFEKLSEFIDNNFKTEILLSSVYEKVQEGIEEEETV